MKAGFFPGQGSQQVGMGKQFYDEFTVFRQTIEEASDSLSIDLKKLLFEGPESERLDLYLQSALLLN
jgi:[acyl-carrier-protein] S-malonyltransferase